MMRGVIDDVVAALGATGLSTFALGATEKSKLSVGRGPPGEFTLVEYRDGRALPLIG